MYNKYIQGDGDMFSELYERVDHEREEQKVKERPSGEKRGLSISKLLSGIDVDKVGILPIVLLLLLLVDAEDEEKLIIIILAFIFGI